MTNAEYDTCDAPAHSTWSAAAKMSDEAVEKLRTGEHIHEFRIEDFHRLPAPLIVIPRPNVHRMICDTPIHDAAAEA